jgi:hypothetical protein
MAHFAKIENGVVCQVIVINNEVLLNEIGEESETIGSEFCQNLFGGDWVQTSYNSKFRGKFAGMGDSWDGESFTSPVMNVEE